MPRRPKYTVQTRHYDRPKNRNEGFMSGPWFDITFKRRDWMKNLQDVGYQKIRRRGSMIETESSRNPSRKEIKFRLPKR